MSDQEIRELERRANAGDHSARDELRRARNRLGSGQALWLVDLLEMAIDGRCALESAIAGVRAIVHAARLKPRRVHAHRGFAPGVRLTFGSEGDARHVRELLEIDGGIGPTNIVIIFGRRDPALRPQWQAHVPVALQDVFVEAVRAAERKFDEKRAAPTEGLVRGQVVSILSPARRTRFVIARVADDGKADVVPLSGTGRAKLVVNASVLSLHQDQQVTFTGPHAEKHRLAYEKLGRASANGNA
jgi:hypothetical protein